MKPAQWTAVLILALMVGGISFVSVYLGGSTREVDQPTVLLPSLNFPMKVFPREGEKVQTTEVHQTGHQDYWFVNDNEQELGVGLNAKGCTCSEVEIAVATPYWMPYLARSAVFQALQQPPCGLHNLTALAAASDREHLFPEMPEAKTTMLTREFSATIPPGAVGRVRLSWHQEVVKPLTTYADLWVGQRGGSVNARLEAGVLIAPPLQAANKDLTISTFSERELEKMKVSKASWIVCFSLTRPAFRVKAEVLHNRFKPESDPIEVGEPIPLATKDLQLIEEKDEQMHRLKPLAGYRIPVRVRAKAKDGTPMEWGRYQRLVQISCDDPNIDPVQVQVSGEVSGDISIGGDEAGTINLGPFPHTRGTKRSIILQTDDKTIDLYLDLKRKPKYLETTLKGPDESAAGHRSWVLKVEVLPKAAVGSFPRADDPDYRDSAIYVKTRKGKDDASLRSVRIPVRGEAN